MSEEDQKFKNSGSSITEEQNKSMVEGTKRSKGRRRCRMKGLCISMVICTLLSILLFALCWLFRVPWLDSIYLFAGCLFTSNGFVLLLFCSTMWSNQKKRDPARQTELELNSMYPDNELI
jgi:hypothetical protein